METSSERSDRNERLQLHQQLAASRNLTHSEVQAFLVRGYQIKILSFSGALESGQRLTRMTCLLFDIVAENSATLPGYGTLGATFTVLFETSRLKKNVILYRAAAAVALFHIS